jgi:acetyltransferase-like isoleucine patch superfamily enzyme
MRLLARIRTTLSGVSVSLVRTYYTTVWGMKIGKGTRISLSAKLDLTHPGGIDIGEYTAITFQAAVLTHDFSNLRHKTTKIGSCCLIGARSIIMAGVRIGDHCIIGAGSIVMSNVPSNSVVMGNPARVVERGVRTTRWGIRQDAYEAALAAENIRAGKALHAEDAN